jgi:hypothetical protein
LIGERRGLGLWMMADGVEQGALRLGSGFTAQSQLSQLMASKLVWGNGNADKRAREMLYIIALS